MYASFFGLRESPFNLTPDPRYLFLSPYHKEALNHLLYGINERKGFIAITGGIGTGKTTLCRALLTHLNAATKSALIFNPFISDMELLRAVNLEFGIDVKEKGETKKGYVDALNQFLLETFSQGGNAVLLIDEAQNLAQPVLEQIRLLSNLETEREKLLQIVLVGQSELNELLRSASLTQLDERIMVRYHLQPLDIKDMHSYVEHRLVIAGGGRNIRFTRGAYKKLFTHSRGNPRRINTVCDRALIIAYTREKYTISKKIIDRAINDLRGEARAHPQVDVWSWKRLVSSTVLLLLLIVAAAFGGWSSKKDLTLRFLDEPKPPVVRAQIAMPVAPKPKKVPPPLFMDEQTSLSYLFAICNKTLNDKNHDIEEVRLSVVSFNVAPEYYVMFKKPFRIHLPGTVSTDGARPRFLLIREVTDSGAIALDAKGGEEKVSRDFILQHWGRNISWIYPYPNKGGNLMKGMGGAEVLDLQKSLNDIGYLVELTGIYDESIHREVSRFQRDFNLIADGIAGPRTMALLYQMTE